VVNELVGSRWVTNALKKLYAFFTFQVFEFSEFLQKLKFSCRHIFRLLHTVKFLIKCILFLGSLSLRFLEARFRNLLELLRKASSWSSAFIREQGSPFPFYHVIRPGRLIQILSSVRLRLCISLIKVQIVLLVIQSLRLRTSHNTNSLWIKIEFRRLDLKLCLSG